MDDFDISKVFKGNAIIIKPSYSGINYCFVCEKIIKAGEVSTHCKLRSHEDRLSRFLSFFTISTQVERHECSKSLTCTACGFYLPWDQAKAHAQEHGDNSWQMPEDIYSIYFQHYLSMNNNTHYCNLCFISFGSREHALQHIEDPAHQEVWSQSVAARTNFEEFSLPPRLIKNLTSHRIFFGDQPDTFFCYVCKMLFPTLTNALDHKQTRSHKSQRFLFKSQVKGCNFNLPNLKWLKKSKSMVFLKDKVYCKQCDLYITDEKEVVAHMESHKVNLPKALEQKSAKLAQQKRDQVILNRPKLIPPMITGLNVPSILGVPEHLFWMISAHKILVYFDYLFCTMCKKKMVTDKCVETHLLSHLKPGKNLTEGSSDTDVNIPASTSLNEARPSTSKTPDNCQKDQELNKRIPLQITETGEISKFGVCEELFWMISDHDVQVYPRFVHCNDCNKKLMDEKSIENHLRTHLKPNWKKQCSTFEKGNFSSPSSFRFGENFMKRKMGSRHQESQQKYRK